MNSSKIMVAGVLFIALVGLLFLDQRREERLDHERRMAERLMPFEREAVSRIQIDRIQGQIVLDRNEDGWSLKTPIDAPVDSQAINEILQALDAQQRIGVQPASEEQLRTFGLEQPPISASITSADGASVDFVVGEDSPVAGEAYAAYAGEQEYFTVSGILKRNLARDVDSIREKSLIAFNANETTTMTLILRGEPQIRAVRRDTEWWLDEPIEVPADEEAIGSILHAVHLTKAQNFVDTDTLNLERYGLDVPTVVAHFESDGETGARSSTLTVGKARDASAKSYYAKRQDRPYVFAVPQGLVYALIPKLEELRAHEVFTIAREDIRVFTLEFAGDAVRLILDDSGYWRFDEPGNQAKADQVMVNESLRFLMTMQVRKYLSFQPTPEMAGLDEPRLRVTIEDGEGKKELIETGRTGQTTDAQDIVYARRDPEGEIFGVPVELPGKLFLTREKFMDKSMYAFDPAQVGSIKYTVIDSRTGEEAAYLFTREESYWMATAVRTAEQAQVGRNVVESMLLHMRAMKWSNRLDPEVDSGRTLIKSSGLEAPPLLLELFDEDQQLITTMGLGPTPDQRFFYLSRYRDGETEYFGVDRNAFLPFAAALRELLQP